MPRRLQYSIRPIVGEIFLPDNLHWLQTQYPDALYRQRALSSAIQSGSSVSGEYYKPDNIHWKNVVVPDINFPVRRLSPAIASGSCWNGEIYIDQGPTVRAHYPDWFPKPSLSLAIHAGSFGIGNVIPPVGGDMLSVIVMLNNSVQGAMQ